MHHHYLYSIVNYYRRFCYGRVYFNFISAFVQFNTYTLQEIIYQQFLNYVILCIYEIIK